MTVLVRPFLRNGERIDGDKHQAAGKSLHWANGFLEDEECGDSSEQRTSISNTPSFHGVCCRVAGQPSLYIDGFLGNVHTTAS